MRLLVFDGDTVENVIDVDPLNIPPEYQDGVEAPNSVGPGWTWDGTDYHPPTPAPVTAAHVKTEAMRRILALAPEWKQRNLTAQAAILAKKGAANWTTDEQSAWDAGEAMWTQIAAIRAASDVIEAIDPMPQNYTDDVYWS